MIYFNSELKSFKLANKQKVKNGLKLIAEQEGKKIDELNYIFVDDDALLAINKQFLAHETFTDIISFDNNDDADEYIEGDIFISIDRVKENAVNFEVEFQDEIFRVISHGLLHLCGYGDKSKDEKVIMREKEDVAIEILRSQLIR
ncbi:MAG: putative rRNA maturation factor [Spirosomataceae bacterium]|jgi:rRNA maturation RNase YbeY